MDLTFKTESDLAKQFVKQVRSLKSMKAFGKDFEFAHIANERISSGNRVQDRAYLYHLKAMGMLAGISDYLILYEGGWAALELKRDKYCKLTDSQTDFKHSCESLKAPYLCTYDLDEAVRFLHRVLS